MGEVVAVTRWPSLQSLQTWTALLCFAVYGLRIKKNDINSPPDMELFGLFLSIHFFECGCPTTGGCHLGPKLPKCIYIDP